MLKFKFQIKSQVMNCESTSKEIKFFIIKDGII
jgi:hypothetical protein